MEPYVQVVLDTEFTSLTQQAQLLSLALVAKISEKHISNKPILTCLKWQKHIKLQQNLFFKKV